MTKWIVTTCIGAATMITGVVKMVAKSKKVKEFAIDKKMLGKVLTVIFKSGNIAVDVLLKKLSKK